MPLRWFECPDGGRIEIGTCLRKGGCRSGVRCATPAYLRMASSDRVWTGKPSTTQLIRGTMDAFLKITREYAVSPDDRAFAVHGTKAHNRLEHFTDADTLAEEQLDGDDVSETGIIDALVVEDGKSVLVDYKTSGSYKVAKALGFHVVQEDTGEVFKSGQRKGTARTRKVLVQGDDMIDRWEWELQLNKYRIELELRGHAVDELRVMCIARDGNTYIAKSRGVFRNTYYFKLRRLPDEIVLRYYKQKREALFLALEQGYWEKPCSPEENWQGIKCTRYCEVAEFCSLGKFLKEERKVMDMPIKGLSDNNRLPRLGKIRLGVKATSKNGKEYPKEVDYFILDPETPSPEGKQVLIDEFHKKYGTEPKAIKVMLPVGDMDIVFPQWYKRYGSSTLLKCKGDGETATCGAKEHAEGLEIINESNGSLTVTCEGRECKFFQNNQCSQVGTLQVLLYEMQGAGVWQVGTGSINSILNVNSAMRFLQAAAGRFHMIPLVLERRPQEMQREGGKATHYPLYLNIAASLAEMQAHAQIDVSKVMLELPAAEGDQDDVFFQQSNQIPLEPPQPFEPPESEFMEVAQSLAGVLGVDVITFGEFCEGHITEEKIGMLRAALKESGMARKDVHKAFNAWINAQIPGEPSTDEATPEVAMEPADDVQGNLDDELESKRARIVELVADTPIESIDEPGFTTWWQGLMPEEAGKTLGELNVLALGVIIAAMEVRADTDADDAAETNGSLF